MKHLSLDSKRFIVKLLNDANANIRAVPRAQELLKGNSHIPFQKSMRWLFPDPSCSEIENALTAAGKKRKFMGQVQFTRRTSRRLDPVRNDENEGEDDKGDSQASGSDTDDLAYPSSESFGHSFTKELRRRYLWLPEELKNEVSQDVINFYRFLSYDPDKVYTVDDPQDNEILNRGLRLLFGNRIGQAQERLRVTPHISYEALPKSLADAIASKLAQEKETIEDVASLLLNPRAR